MLDVFDRAQAREAELRQDALAEHQRRAAAVLGQEGDAERWRELSAEFCEGTGCGAPIPDRRRQLMPRCRLCVDCQGRKEARLKRSAG
ncbi:TraR/DksA C4-type zinc finger protein [Roseateles sp. DXS20W]|uniref:TraR/DksA C4-type zinc finger protein n=1 Tax=Pelomonas lactea TaxID=3299030 RepID=A0ABW7GKH3_9BURK